MAIKIDSNLVAILENDSDFQKMASAISYEGDRIFRKAWVLFEADKGSPKIKKWFPILIKDRQNGDVGFEYNPGGWQSKEKAGKTKISLAKLLSIIITRTYHEKDTIRSSYGEGSDQNGRRIYDMQFDAELTELINKYQNNATILELENSLVAKSPYKQAFSHDQKELAIQAAEEISGLLKGFDGQEKDIIAKYRTNQGKFRKILLDYWDGTCAVSGLGDERLLIASHILPWSKSNEHQKGDPCNGLLLSVVWDALFDKGLVAFDDEGKVILNKLDNDVMHRLGLNGETSCIIMPNKITKEHRLYLQMHRVLHGFY